MTVVGSHPSACAASSGFFVAKSLKPTSNFLFAQTGQPLFLVPVRCSGEIFQEWPSEHFHRYLLLLPAPTNLGSHPSASFAISGKQVARSLKPGRTWRFEQIGQPLFLCVRASGETTHVCPIEHSHNFFLSLPAITSRGSHPAASEAILGWVVAKSLNPARTFLFEQTGQPFNFA